MPISPPRKPLDQLHLRGPLGAGVEVGPLGVGLRPKVGRRRLDLQQLLADQEQRARTDGSTGP